MSIHKTFSIAIHFVIFVPHPVFTKNVGVTLKRQTQMLFSKKTEGLLCSQTHSTKHQGSNWMLGAEETNHSFRSAFSDLFEQIFILFRFIRALQRANTRFL